MKGNERKLFSIIIPVYNSSTFLDECLQSVLKQDIQDFEIILVDDGSTDNSGKKCDYYAARYPQLINVYHTLNYGQLHARLYGMKVACAKYYIFLDSDDYLEPGTLTYLYCIFQQEDIDCIIYGMQRVCEGVIGKKYVDDHSELIADKKIIYSKCLLKSSYNSMCRKAFKAELASQKDYSKYYHIRYGEDLLQSIELLENCKNVFFSDKILYNYRVNPSSVTGNDNHRIEVDYIVPKILCDFLVKEDVLTEEKLVEYIEREIREMLIPNIKKLSYSNLGLLEKKQKLDIMRHSEYFIDYLSKGLRKKNSSISDYCIYHVFILHGDTFLLLLLQLGYKLRHSR